MRILFAAPLLIALATPAAAQQRQPREPAPEAQPERCGVRQDSWGAIAPGAQAERGKRSERAECAKRHLIEWSPEARGGAQRAK